MYAQAISAALVSYAPKCSLYLPLWLAGLPISAGHAPPVCSGLEWVSQRHSGSALPCLWAVFLWPALVIFLPPSGANSCCVWFFSLTAIDTCKVNRCSLAPSFVVLGLDFFKLFSCVLGFYNRRVRLFNGCVLVVYWLCFRCIGCVLAGYWVFVMRALGWNCRGIYNASTVRALRAQNRGHKPNIIFFV